MWFLLLQISLLLVLAAVLGAALSWWWMKRRYEDVTDSHERLIAESNRMERLTQLASREDLKTGIATLSTAVADIKPADLSPALERLQRIEHFIAGIQMPDMRPVQERIAGLSTQISQQPRPDFGPVEKRLSELEQTIRSIRIPAPDLGPVHSGIATLQLALDKSQSQTKTLEPIEGRLGVLEQKLGEFETVRRSDHETVSTHLELVSSAVGALRNTDLDPVATRLASVEQAITNFHIPATDLRPLHASMIDLERAVMGLDKAPVDLAPLHNRLAALQASLAGMQAELRNRQALEAVERRIASLQEAVQGIPEPDLAPIVGAVHSIDARLDLGALENRLTAIEYGLAALHHTLRSRPDAVVTRTDATWQQRPVMNGPAPRPRMPAPPRPPRETDPINVVRRPDDQANLLTDPAFGPPDDLEQIHGVGPMLRELLHDIGVYYFWQVAEWTPDEVAFVDSRLMHFKGRIRRDDWIDHARTLAAAPTSARRPAVQAATAD